LISLIKVLPTQFQCFITQFICSHYDTGRASKPIQRHLVICAQEAADGIEPLDLIVPFDTEIHFS
jgi:hypothetical protein